MTDSFFGGKKGRTWISGEVKLERESGTISGYNKKKTTLIFSFSFVFIFLHLLLLDYQLIVEISEKLLRVGIGDSTLAILHRDDVYSFQIDADDVKSF